MKAPGRRALLAFFVVVALAFGAPLAGAAAARPKPQTTWHLVDYGQRACFSSRVTDSYFGVWISGRWTHAINVGAQRLPTGGGYDTSYAPIAPGSSTGEYSLAYVHVMLTPTTPIGTYTASLWASDGSRSQSVPIILDVRARCGY
jgi:uncharacterized protein DUF5980